MFELYSAGTTIAVNVPDWTELENRVTGRLRDGHGFALATLNLDHLVKMQASSDFKRAYACHDMIVADGNPIVWISRLAGAPVKLIPGSDAIFPLARIAAREGVSVALVGSTEDTLVAAKTYMESRIDGLKVTACVAPPMGFDPRGAEAEAVFETLRASGAGLCFVALGAPKQEIFAAEGRRVLPGMGFASIGAGLDFFAGTQRRAPEWARRLAMEWLWRLATNPRRLTPRYARCVAILPGQVMHAFLTRMRGQAA